MSMNSKGLGRGLDALFQVSQMQTEQPAGGEGSQLQYLNIESLTPNPNQPREKFTEESIQELAQSIKERGILQPLLARPAAEDGHYQIIAGERRWRAAKIAGLREVPALVRTLNDEEAMIIALIENIQREDLNPIEQAKGLVALKEKLGVSQEALAEKLGKQRGTLSNMIRLLRLSEQAQTDLIEGRITAGHARCILGVTPGECADEFLKHIIESDMTVRAAEEAVNYWRTEERFPWQKSDQASRGKKEKNPDMMRLATEVGSLLRCRAQIHGNIEKGRISLNYESNEQLYDLLEKLGLKLTS